VAQVSRRPFLESIYFAWAGLRWAWQTQGNMRRHIAVAIAVLILARICAFSPEKQVLILLTVTLVITAELMNTAVEALIDVCVPRYHPLAKRAKDVAAAAVLVTAIAAGAVGFFLFGSYLLQFLSAGNLFLP
jgi:diacylglycerol kinase